MKRDTKNVQPAWRYRTHATKYVFINDRMQHLCKSRTNLRRLAFFLELRNEEVYPKWCERARAMHTNSERSRGARLCCFNYFGDRGASECELMALLVRRLNILDINGLIVGIYVELYLCVPVLHVNRRSLQLKSKRYKNTNKSGLNITSKSKFSFRTLLNLFKLLL